MSSFAMERVLDTLYAKETKSTGVAQEFADAQFMKSICEIYELKHSAYITVDKRSFASRRPKFLVTYPENWQLEYKRSFAERKDPVLLAGLSEMLPFDWQRLKLKLPESDMMIGLAREYGIGRQGLTIPIRGRSGARALFSVTGDYNDRDWQDMRRQYLRDFVILANFFHKRIGGGIPDVAPELSEREREILQFCALGLTASEIADRLQISTSTVKYFLNKIHYKMDVLNTTHAVAKGIKFGIITVL